MLRQGHTLRLFLLSCLTACLLVSPSLSLAKCKKEILNNFYLTGLDIAIYEPMTVCPHVHDKCCSLGDEIKMKHMYDKHTAPILERRVAFIMRSIGQTLESFFEMMDIDVNLMVLKYSVPREVFYKEIGCQARSRSLPSPGLKKAFKRYYSKYGIPKPKKKKKKKTKGKKKKTKGKRMLMEKVRIN